MPPGGSWEVRFFFGAAEGHVFGGARVRCDREILKDCVSIWFGQREAFEDYVRLRVAEEMSAGLEHLVFTRSWSPCGAGNVVVFFFFGGCPYYIVLAGVSSILFAECYGISDRRLFQAKIE